MNKIKFIHITKTGGASIQNIIQHLDNVVLAHHHPIKPEDEQYTTFAVVRDPYARVESMYNFYKYRRNVVVENTFEGFVNNIKHYQNVSHGGTLMAFKPCFNYLSINGELKVSKVLRFENLRNDYIDFASTYGLPKQLEHVNKNNEKRPITWSPNMRKIVQEVYFKDFEVFDYPIWK